MQRRQGRVNAGLLLLLYQISQVGLQNIPPVTLGVLALNVFLFLNPVRPLAEVCISVNEAIYRKDWQRLLLSPFHHADDWHLYYNMISMLWKGIMLEKKLKSVWFAYVIAVFSVLVGLVYVVLEFLLVKILDDPSYGMSCGVGFSGVLFALKVLNNHYNPGRVSTVLGVRLSSKYACWVELLAIHFIAPGTSFAGHLAGILVGLMYTKGPLKKIMEACAGGISFFTDHGRPRDYYSGHVSPFLFGEVCGCILYQMLKPQSEVMTPKMLPLGNIIPSAEGVAMGKLSADSSPLDLDYYGYYPGYQYRTPRNYYDYTGGLTEEEQLERAVLNSLNERDFGGATYNDERRPYGFWFPPEHPEEEMRRQRLRRFERR